MTITQSLEQSILHELNVCQHLHGKFDAAHADWRPAPNMRSTVELMQYLSFIGKAMTRQFITTPVDHEEARAAYRADAVWSKQHVTFDNFVEHIEQEKEAVRESFAGLTDAGLDRMTYHPFTGAECSVFDALVNSVAKYVCAYRHQLFLYAKMCGAEINTLNNWFGQDPAPKEATV